MCLVSVYTITIQGDVSVRQQGWVDLQFGLFPADVPLLQSLTAQAAQCSSRIPVVKMFRSVTVTLQFFATGAFCQPNPFTNLMSLPVQDCHFCLASPLGWFRRRKRTSLPPPPQSRPLPSPIYPQQSPESPLACCLKEHAHKTSAHCLSQGTKFKKIFF